MALLGPKIEQRVLRTERRVLKFRQHWAAMLPVVLQTVIGVLLLIMLSIYSGSSPNLWFWQSLLWYVEIALIIRMAWYMAVWWYDTVVVTDRRIMRDKGVIQDNMAWMPLSKVTDLDIRRSAWARLCGYSNIHVESAGQVQGLDLLPYVPEPYTVEEAIAKLQFGKGSDHESKSLPRKKRSRKEKRKPRGRSLDDLSNEWGEEND
jgi:uncharacterized membrane protein YdbT with pleckstrin-like domain